MSLPEEQSSYKEPLSPIGRMQLGLAASFVTPSPKKTDGKADRAVNIRSSQQDDIDGTARPVLLFPSS